MCDLEIEVWLQCNNAFIMVFLFDCSIYTGYKIVPVIDIVILEINLNWYLCLWIFYNEQQVTL